MNHKVRFMVSEIVRVPAPLRNTGGGRNQDPLPSGEEHSSSISPLCFQKSNSLSFTLYSDIPSHFDAFFLRCCSLGCQPKAVQKEEAGRRGSFSPTDGCCAFLLAEKRIRKLRYSFHHSLIRTFRAICWSITCFNVRRREGWQAHLHDSSSAWMEMLELTF